MGGFLNLDPGILALVAGTVFFVLLGILVLIIGQIEGRKWWGILFLLVGITLAMFASGGWDIAVIFIAIIAALVVNVLLERFGIVE